MTSAKVLMLTTFDLDEYVYDALRAGASGFLLKDRPPEELVHAVRVVAAGDALLAPGVTRRLIGEFAASAERARTGPGLDELTDREREVLVLMARGLSNAEIASRAVRRRDHGEDPRRARAAQAAPARSSAGGRPRLRVRPGAARRLSRPVILQEDRRTVPAADAAPLRRS